MNITINAVDTAIDSAFALSRIDQQIKDDMNHVPGLCSDTLSINITSVRIGAETCASLLRFIPEDKMIDAADYAHQYGKNVYLVTPVVPEFAWQQICGLVTRCVNRGILDGIVINDFGMIDLVKDLGLPITLGRLYDKRLRDPRVDSREFWNNRSEESGIFSTAYVDFLKREQIVSVDLEMLELGIHEVIPPCLDQIFFHVPYTLITCGMICEYSGVSKCNDERFRIAQCDGQCRNIVAVTNSPPLRSTLLKKTNAIYMVSPVSGQRILDLLQNPRIQFVYTCRQGELI